MTARAKIDPATLAVAASVQALVDEAVRLERLRIAALERELARHDRVREACRRVGVASDAVQQARYAGTAVERKMMARLERAAKELSDVMRKGKA